MLLSKHLTTTPIVVARRMIQGDVRTSSINGSSSTMIGYWFSSTAASRWDDDSGSKPEPEPVTSSSPSSSLRPGATRPRLQALRDRLAQEQRQQQQQGSVSNSTSPNTSSSVLLQQWSSSQNQNPPESKKKHDERIDESNKKNKKKSFSNDHNDDDDDDQSSLQQVLQILQDEPPIPIPSSSVSDDNDNSLLLQDSYRRRHSYLRISLVERCNLRCQYCMPPNGVPLQPSSNLLTRSEILQLTRLFVRHGVRKVRLTGGEPLLRHDLVDIVQDLSTLRTPEQQEGSSPSLSLQQIGMTTNGVTLSKHLPQLVDAGLTHVNISLDTLKSDVFQDLTRRPGVLLDKVLESIDVACTLLPAPGRVKLNVVVMKNVNDNELEDFCYLSQRYPTLDVRFIEWMPFNQNGWNQNRFVGYETMLSSLEHLNLQRLDDGPNDTTKWWTLPSLNTTATTTATDDDGTDSGSRATTVVGRGRIGFITSMSQHFCGTCNRLRLTSDGKLKTCLFGTSEISLRHVLRRRRDVADAANMTMMTSSTSSTTTTTTEEEMLEKLIYYAIQRKTFALGGHGSALGIAKHSHDNRPMTLIGG